MGILLISLLASKEGSSILITIMPEPIQDVLDVRGALRCVRFASGEVGVVGPQGTVLLVVGAFQQLAFAEHGFLKARNRMGGEGGADSVHGRHCVGDERGDERAEDVGDADERVLFIDMKNGALYARMPELVRFGDFEVASIGGYLCTRTKTLYEVQAIPAEAWHGKGGAYLSLPYRGEPDEGIRRRMIWTPGRYQVCLLCGDESGVYWKMQVFEDHSLLVMDDAGNYFHVKKNTRARRVVKAHLGQVNNDADRAMMAHAVREIEERVADRQRREATKAQREATKERERQMAMLVTAEPFSIGNKWGLRSKGRIVVPPIYRRVRRPVGRYCAIETCPGIWGVMAVDGRVEVEARYEDVVVHTDGTVDLTVRPGKVITKKLP